MTSRAQFMLPSPHRQPKRNHVLPEISRLIEEHPELAAAVEADLVAEQDQDQAMSGEQVLRVLVVGHIHDYDNGRLSFYVSEHRTYGQFCFMGAPVPDCETIERNLASVSDESWERAHRMFLQRSEGWKREYRYRQRKAGVSTQW